MVPHRQTGIARRRILLVRLGLLSGLLVATGAGIASQDPAERAEAAFYEAEGAWTAGRIDEALGAFANLVANFPASRYPGLSWRSASLVRAGEIHIALGHLDTAAANLLSAIEDEPASSWDRRARLGLASLLLWRGEWEGAAELLQTVVDGAEQDDPGAAAAAALARDRLTLLYRVWLRPTTSAQPWDRTRRLDLPGVRLDDPIGIAADDAGALLITDEGSDQVILVDSEGNARSFETQNPRRPWWGADGLGYVALEGAIRIPQRGERLQFFRPGGGQPRPVEDFETGARTGLGDWILLDRDRDLVLRFGPGGEFVGILDVGSEAEPIDLGRDDRGRLFVLDRRRPMVLQLDTEGVLTGAVAFDRWEEPVALDVDHAGNVYVLDRDSKRIDVFGPEGALAWTLGPVFPGGFELDDPRDVTVDSAGRVYIADRGANSVVVIE